MLIYEQYGKIPVKLKQNLIATNVAGTHNGVQVLLNANSELYHDHILNMYLDYGFILRLGYDDRFAPGSHLSAATGQ